MLNALDCTDDEAAGGQLLTYNGATNSIPGLPTRNDLIKASDATGLSGTLARQLIEKRVFFMPNDVNEENDYVRGDPVYVLHLYGALIDGSKALVILDNIPVFFDVLVPPQGLGDCLLTLAERKIQPVDVKEIKAFPVRGFRKSRVLWKRLYFLNTQSRKQAIDVAREQGLETASDDRSNFFRMAARTHNQGQGLVLTDWGLLTNFVYRVGRVDEKLPVSPLCEYVFRLDVADYHAAEGAPADDRSLVLTWDIETYDSGRTGELPLASNAKTCVFMIALTVHWKNDPTALYRVCLVDTPIEPDKRWATVECGNEVGIIKAFAVVFRHFAPDFIIGFNDGAYDWPFILEKARQTKGLLTFMVNTMSARPRRGTLDDVAVWRWSVNSGKMIKIDAGVSAAVTFLKVPGSIPIDVRVLFLQLYPKAEVGKGSSLNFYLKACNLAGKDDMPYTQMWDAYAAKDSIRMRQVAHYCVVDANRCQELLVARNVINDRREEANLSYVSLYDALYYARGHKVCNMLSAYAFRRDILCSNINRPDGDHGKYPGAWVFYPEKGLIPDPQEPGVVALEAARAKLLTSKGEAEILEVEQALESYHPGRPVVCLDFASLYPSLIMTYNLSPEKFVETADEAQRLEAEGYSLYCTKFMFGGAEVVGWFVRHRGVDADYGLYPTVLLDLFGKRVLLKKKLAAEESRKEDMEIVAAALKMDAARQSLSERSVAPAVFERESSRPAAGYLAAITKKPAITQLEAFQALYRDTCFRYTAIDSKQKALKVFMNTFYGEAGHSISPFFLLQLAGAVTTAGQYNIKMVADFVRMKGFRIKYGDTDSLYITPTDSIFVEFDRNYGLGSLTKEAYWSAMVERTMAELNALRDDVNNHLKADNGTPHLKMAYEEVLYPVVFTGKKKYFGIAHLSTPNFRPNKLFIRGIDVVKQGQTELARTIGYRIMWAAVSITNTKTVLAITEDVLREAVENVKQWEFDHFVQSDAWKPDKDNKAVQRFVARMRVRVAAEKSENERRARCGLEPIETLYTIPSPGERFHYILAKSSETFDLRGHKANPKKGDIMEYAKVAQAKGIPIDVAQYLKNYVIGLCARFINFSEPFTPPPSARGELDDKSLDKKAQDAAKKYLETFIARLQSADPEVIRKKGYAYKKAWRNAALECGERLRKTLGPVAEVLHGEDLDWTAFIPTEECEDCISALVARAQSTAEQLFDAPAYTSAYAEALGIAVDGGDIGNPGSARSLYGAAKYLGGRTLRMETLAVLSRREAAIRTRLAELMPQMIDTATDYEHVLAGIVNIWRAREHASRPAELGEKPDAPAAVQEFAPDATAVARLQEVRDLWYELLGIFRVWAHHRAIVAHLHALKDRRQRCDAAPDPETRRRVIAESKRNLPPLRIGTIGDDVC